MAVDPAIVQAPMTIRTCPQCGTGAYTVKVTSEPQGMRLDTIVCARCGFDILAAFRALKAKGQNDA